MIRVTINSFAEVEAELKRRALRVPGALATEAKKIIVTNSAAGVDIKGHKMVDYTLAYKKWKERHGLAGAPANLRVTDHLLDFQKIEVHGLRSSLRPSVTDTLIAEGNMRYRKFYPETDSDVTPDFLAQIALAGEAAMSEN